MTLSCVHLLATGLAVWQAVETFHHAKITVPLRRALAALADYGRVGLFIADLSECAFCVAHWMAAIIVGFCFVCPLGEQIVLILAAVRIATLGNDLTKDFENTPKHELDEPETAAGPAAAGLVD